MQISEINEKKYNTYTFDKYLLIFDLDVEFKDYAFEQQYGIIFYVGNNSYDVIHNIHTGNRIIINDGKGLLQDIPFKKDTFEFLPKGVKAVEI